MTTEQTIVDAIAHYKTDRSPADNNTRADFNSIIFALCHHLLNVNPSSDADGPETAATDVLTNMMHAARRDGWSFSNAIESARRHFEAEVCSVCGETSEDAGICFNCYEEGK